MFRVLYFTKKYGKILRTVKVLPYALQLNIISRRENVATNNTNGGDITFCFRTRHDARTITTTTANHP